MHDLIIWTDYRGGISSSSERSEWPSEQNWRASRKGSDWCWWVWSYQTQSALVQPVIATATGGVQWCYSCHIGHCHDKNLGQLHGEQRYQDDEWWCQTAIRFPGGGAPCTRCDGWCSRTTGLWWIDRKRFREFLKAGRQVEGKYMFKRQMALDDCLELFADKYWIKRLMLVAEFFSSPLLVLINEAVQGWSVIINAENASKKRAFCSIN